MNFDATFLTRLRQRDPEACAFLISSLTPMLEAKLRYKFRDHGTIEDIRNETFCRVFSLVDRGCVRQPERFGAFVWGVCDKVAQETYRKTRVAEPLPCAMEAPDGQPHRDELLVKAERTALVWREVMKSPTSERMLIVDWCFENRKRCEMAGDLGISITAVKVRLCRALKRLRHNVLLQESAGKLRVNDAARVSGRRHRVTTCRLAQPVQAAGILQPTVPKK